MSKFMKFGACAAMVVSAGVATATTWTEVGDAGELVATHQVPVGVGALTNIYGTLATGHADMYCIYIDGATFSAEGVALAGPGGGTWDSQLFLFTMAGVGVAANDDGGGLAGNGILPVGNALYSGLSGHYLLAISAYDYDPRDASGALIFETFPFPPVYGPFAGAGPLDHWSGPSFSGGDYDIVLTGASFCDFPVIPLPTPLGLSLAGFAGVVAFRRRR